MLLEVAAELAGVSGPCPGCRRMITAPRTSSRARQPEPSPADSAQGESGHGEEEPGVKESERSGLGQPSLPQEELPGAQSSPFAEQGAGRVRKVRRRRKRRKQQAKAQHEVRSRTDHPLDPVTALSRSYREKRSSMAIIKLVLAFLLTLAAVISIIRITQKGVAGPSPGGEEEVIENLSR
ncbi:MAG TPA: hypothetical protein DCS85_02600 [Verrucomicrobiales bacterium]|nr:hypothetical protein [Roseibacillus sp.]HAT19023.1 hypothetical protein [Verrucomicrobiales bacterium]